MFARTAEAIRRMAAYVVVFSLCFAIGSAVAQMGWSQSPYGVHDAARRSDGAERILCLAESSPTAVASGDDGIPSCDIYRSMRVQVASDGGDVDPRDRNWELHGADGGDSVDVTHLGGQAITLGAGAVAAGTQRMTLGNDDPAVVSLGIMDDWDTTHNSTVSADGPQIMCESADQDGAALPNAVTAEGEAVRPKASLQGVLYSARVSEDGSTIAPTMDAVGRAGYQYITDGTNTMPTMDVVGRRGYVQHTDGTNSTPAMDAAARAGYQYITDGTNTMPTMDTAARRGYMTHTDGTNSMPTGDTAARRVYTEPTATGAALSATNPLWCEMTDGSAAVSSANPLDVQLGDGTDQVNIQTATSLTIDDAATNDGLQTASLLYGYDDTGAAETWRGIAVDASGRPEIDVVANTAGLCLDATAQSIQTAVEIVDDWDETNRAAVNIIASQVGITGGAGAVAANSPRITLASDDPAVTSLGTLDNAISGSEMQVDVITSALPSGAATEASLSSIDGKITACNTGAVTVNAALPAGDNNIGNVDIASLPAGNLGQQLSAASLSVTPATNIADATYVGDIKFGEALPAGTNTVGAVNPNARQYDDDNAAVTCGSGWTSAIASLTQGTTQVELTATVEDILLCWDDSTPTCTTAYQAIPAGVTKFRVAANTDLRCYSAGGTGKLYYSVVQ